MFSKYNKNFKINKLLIIGEGEEKYNLLKLIKIIKWKIIFF